MSWLDSPMLAVDTETTGTDPETARVVQITIGLSPRPGDWLPWTRVVNPGVPIPDDAAKVHGYDDTRVQTEGTTPSAALTKAWATLTDTTRRHIPVVAHNAAYDLTVLDREFRRHLGEPLPSGLIVLDTLCLYRRFDWRTGGRSLTKLAARHGITFPAHDAEADALASLRLLHILANSNDVLPLIPAAALHEAQRGWWVQQQDAAEAHAHGNGTPFTRQDSWPLIPAEVTR